MTTFAPAPLDAAGSSGESNPISVDTRVASPGASGSGATSAREFSPYIDMAMPADANLSAIAAASGIHNFTLAFVLSSGSGIGWQGVGTISDDTLANGTTILSQVQAMQAAGADVTISFGGAAGQEAALTATSTATLQAEYQSVIDRYHVHSLDFDIEGMAVQDQHSITLRDQALVGLKAANPGLVISYTLPVLPTGLTADGLNVLASAKHDGLAIDVVNIMAMDYGSAVDNGGQMGIDAIDAAVATEGQIAAGGLSAKLGVTPMIGVNDISSEVFSLADAQALLNYAQTDSNIVRLAMWSVARDNGNSAGAHFASPDSSGIAQQPYDFSAIFRQFDRGAAQQSLNPPAPVGTTADMVLRRGDGTYEIYDIGNNAILAAYSLGQVGTDWQFAGLGGFQAGNTIDMFLRRQSTTSPAGSFEIYNISNNNVTNAALLGQLGLLGGEAQGFGNFSSRGENDMMLREGPGFLVYDIANDQITGKFPLGNVALEWHIGGFGQFSGNPGAYDMILRNINTGGLQVYDISNNQITNSAFMGAVGLDWQISGFGNFSSRPGETDMIMRNTNTGGLLVYDIANNQVTGATALGTVGLEWQFAGVAPIRGAGTSDLVLRNVNTGQFEVYNIANNQITGAVGLGQVGLEWQLGGFAADASTPSMGSSDGSTSQLVQAMASFGGGGGAADGSNTVLPSADTQQQPLLTTPQHV
ncbi:MAG TPA: chitinase [Xanthobacteraceae bacterium]|nr:chitinase [Xanthobacteraceae bacterium]